MRKKGLSATTMAVALAAPLASSQAATAPATEMDFFLDGNVMQELGSAAVEDRARLAQLRRGDRGQPGIETVEGCPPDVDGGGVDAGDGEEALSIAVCSLNACSDATCGEDRAAGPGGGQGDEAASVADCSPLCIQ